MKNQAQAAPEFPSAMPVGEQKKFKNGQSLAW